MLLGIKQVYDNFYPLEVVGRGSETQLQVHGWKFKCYNAASYKSRCERLVGLKELKVNNLHIAIIHRGLRVSKHTLDVKTMLFYTLSQQ